MKKILIVGSKGMAGHLICQYLKENTEYIIVDIARGSDYPAPLYPMDVTNFEALREVFKNEQPDIVINCIGILNKDAEDHPDKAIMLNSYLPHFMAKCGTERGFKVIHISTDCVFNGKSGGYTEDSLKDGQGYYAQTKALGEINYRNHLTIRTSIIGPELKANGIGLFHWFMQQEGEIKGYRSAFWTGVTTLELAKSIVAAIDQNITGLHHLVNGGKINKYDLTNLFKNVFDKDNVTIVPDDDYKIDKSLVKTNDLFRYTVPAYPTMIEEMRDWIKDHPTLYSHYLDHI